MQTYSSCSSASARYAELEDIGVLDDLNGLDRTPLNLHIACQLFDVPDITGQPSWQLGRQFRLQLPFARGAADIMNVEPAKFA